jgi:hypothetical protein
MGERSVSMGIATKVRLGKLSTGADLMGDFTGYLEREGFETLAISANMRFVLAYSPALTKILSSVCS